MGHRPGLDTAMATVTFIQNCQKFSKLHHGQNVSFLEKVIKLLRWCGYLQDTARLAHVGFIIPLALRETHCHDHFRGGRKSQEVIINYYYY
jgi:hypothetical protein